MYNIVPVCLFQAHQCTGKCSFPIDNNLSPSKHAIFQALMNKSFPRKVAKPCCVPTKLEPISILYIERNVVTFKYSYEGMVVASCGCRWNLELYIQRCVWSIGTLNYRFNVVYEALEPWTIEFNVVCEAMIHKQQFNNGGIGRSTYWC